MKAAPKILYLITKSEPFGGAQKYVFDLAANLPPEKFQVKVALGGSGLLAEKLRRAEIETLNLVDLARDINFFKEIKTLGQILKILRQEKPNILHISSSKAGGLGTLASRLYNFLALMTNGYRLKTIFTVHGWPFLEDRLVWQRLTIKFLSWLTCLLSHKIILVSEYDWHLVKNWPLVQNRFVIIKNGVREQPLIQKEVARKMMAGIVKEKNGQSLPTEGIWIGTISELHRNKGLEYAISAFSQLLEAKPPTIETHLIIIGEGEERQALEELISLLKLENKVFLAGFIENASSLLAAFDIFTLTSIKEGLPYTLLEAGLAGLPVVASRVGGIPEILGENGILVQPKNTAEIKAGLKELLPNSEKRKKLGRDLQQKVKSEFNFKQTLEATIKLY